MRPTPEGVGNRRVTVEALDRRGASMRPTPEGVGNARLGAPVAGGEPVASMRPTPEGVGNRFPVPAYWPPSSLQ